MILSVDEKSFNHQIQSIILYLLSTIITTLIISVGLVTSTHVSGYHEYNLRHAVNKSACTCDCWDGFFRGIYGRGGYKTFYFNYEYQTMIIVCVTLFYSELLRRILSNVFLEKQFIVLLILIPSIYSNFYGIWCIINYINDHDYQRMLKSQIFFSVTELLVCYLFYQCLAIKNKLRIPPWIIYLLCTISCLHILLAIGELNFNQIVRNFGLVVSDLISLSWVTVMLLKYHQLRPDKQTIYIWIFIGLCLWLFYHVFCPFHEKL